MEAYNAVNSQERASAEGVWDLMVVEYVNQKAGLVDTQDSSALHQMVEGQLP